MQRPNLLFLYTDEQAFNTLAAYGNSGIHMPNLNRLADQSVVFDQAYVTQPVCTPSRGSLLTGLYPHTHGCIGNNMPLRAETPCLPEMLAPGGYVTGHFGKWHLGDELFPQHGFQEWVSVEDEYNAWFSPGRDRDTRSDYHHFLLRNGFTPANGRRFGRGEAARLPEAFGKPAFLAQEASQFLRRHRDHPFVLHVNFLEPHMPFFGPRDDQYDPQSIPLPANFDAPPTAAQPLKARLFHAYYRHLGASGIALADPDGWRRLRAHYWGLCSLIDTHVGAILDTLNACGLDDRTIVVFTSDHGDMMGAHQLVAKCLMYQEAVRVPLMLRIPGRTGGARVSGPVSQIDLVPTLLDLMEQPVPPTLQGRSLRPWIEQPEKTFEEPVVIEWNGSETGMADLPPQTPAPAWMTALGDPDTLQAACADPVRTVITPEGWKFNASAQGEHELYDLATDPGETINLYHHPAHQSRAADLFAYIRQWQARTNDPTPLAKIL